MGTNTRYNRFKHAQSVLMDLFGSAKVGQWTHAHFLERRTALLTNSELWNGPKHKRLTIAEKEYLRGMGDAMHRTIVDYCCIWAFDIGESRPMRTAEMTREQKDDFYALSGDEMTKLGHFYWKDASGNPSEKYWF